jgi:CRP-like cAMP-binding protein
MFCLRSLRRPAERVNRGNPPHLRVLVRQLTKSCEPNSITRVARKIVDLVGVHSGATLYATQNEMAEMLNNSRSTISKSLMMLERKEIIRNGYRYIVVQDGEALLKLAQ